MTYKEKNGKIYSITLKDYDKLKVPYEIFQFQYLYELEFENCSFAEFNIPGNKQIKRIIFDGCDLINPVFLVKDCIALRFLAAVASRKRVRTLSLDQLPRSLDTLYLEKNKTRSITASKPHPMTSLVLNESYLNDLDFLKMLPNVDLTSSESPAKDPGLMLESSY